MSCPDGLCTAYGIKQLICMHTFAWAEVQRACTRMKDLDGVVGGAAAGQRARGDDARVAQRAEVHARLGVVVRAQQLLVHLRRGAPATLSMLHLRMQCCA